MKRFDTYGVNYHAKLEDDTDRMAEELSIRGFTILSEVIPAFEVSELNDVMDEVYHRQCRDVGGELELMKINDADVARCLLAYSAAYMRLALHPIMIGFVKKILGDNIVLIMQNGIINRPEREQFQTKWHRDLNYQHWTISQPIALSALVCLEDFNEETGGTVFIPGTHKIERFPSQEFAAKMQETPIAKKGSILVFDSMLFHRAGVNRSGRIRRAVNHVFGAPILGQQVDIPAMLAKPTPADPWLAGYLGYRWRPVGDVAAWRRRKIEAVTETPSDA